MITTSFSTLKKIQLLCKGLRKTEKQQPWNHYTLVIEKLKQGIFYYKLNTISIYATFITLATLDAKTEFAFIKFLFEVALYCASNGAGKYIFNSSKCQVFLLILVY